MSEETQENKTVVTINKGGPVKITGLFTITGVNGEKLEVESSNQVYLCACGQSKNKPFCDGSHKGVTT